MTDTSSRKRQPRGTTTGGQFATDPKPEPQLSLGGTPAAGSISLAMSTYPYSSIDVPALSVPARELEAGQVVAIQPGERVNDQLFTDDVLIGVVSSHHQDESDFTRIALSPLPRAAGQMFSRTFASHVTVDGPVTVLNDPSIVTDSRDARGKDLATSVRGRAGSDVWERYLGASHEQQVEYLRAHGIPKMDFDSAHRQLTIILGKEGIAAPQ